MGRRIGIGEIRRAYAFRDRVFSDVGQEIQRGERFGETLTFQCQIQVAHIGQDWEGGESVSEGSYNSRAFEILRKAPPTEKEILLQGEAIFIFRSQKVERLIAQLDTRPLLKTVGPPVGPKECIEKLVEVYEKKLSPMELQCLSLLSGGFGAKRVGELLNLSHRTVESYLRNAYFKLDCLNKEQVIELMYENYTITVFHELGRTLIARAKGIELALSP